MESWAFGEPSGTGEGGFESWAFGEAAGNDVDPEEGAPPAYTPPITPITSAVMTRS